MASLLAFTTWALLGTIAVIATAAPGEPRDGWLPYGIILGPFWLCIAAEREPAAIPVTDNSDRIPTSSRS